MHSAQKKSISMPALRSPSFLLSSLSVGLTLSPPLTGPLMGLCRLAVGVGWEPGGGAGVPASGMVLVADSGSCAAGEHDVATINVVGS